MPPSCLVCRVTMPLAREKHEDTAGADLPPPGCLRFKYALSTHDIMELKLMQDPAIPPCQRIIFWMTRRRISAAGRDFHVTGGRDIKSPILIHGADRKVPKIGLGR